MEQSKNKKAIIYCRVSTKEQADEGNSLITQERFCRDYANKNGFEVVATFIEEGESAKTTNRKQLLKMIEFCRKNKGKINSIIFYKIDRLSRDTADYLSLKVLFNKLGISICSTSEIIENTPTGRFMETVIAGSAQFDNEVRSERCRNGMIEAARSGRRPFKAPIGYINSEVNGEPNLIINEKRAGFIRLIFERLATGLYSQEEVRREVNKNGAMLNNGNYISKQYMNVIARNKVYKGIIDSFNLGEIKGSFEPIISEELFDKVQYILNNRAKRKSGYNTLNPDFPLRGVIISEGGNKLDGSWSKGNAKQKFPYYRFRNQKGFNVRKEKFEEQFKEYLKKFEFKSEFVDLLKDSLAINWEHRHQSNKQLKAKAEKKIVELKTKQELIVDKNLKDIIPDDLAKEQLEKIKSEIVALNMKLREYEGDENIQEVLDFSLGLMQNLVERIEKLKIKQRKDLQWFLFPDGVVFDGQKFRTTRTALILDTKMTSRAEKSNYVDRTGLEPATSAVQMRRSTR